jgi:exodeoxyribonuclease V alpha subunit
MTDVTVKENRIIEHLNTFKILNGAEPSATASLEPFIRCMDLSLIDYMTIRDLLDLGGCKGDAALVFVLMTMFAWLREGSICLNLDKARVLSRLPDDDRKNAGALFDAFISGLEQGRYRNLIAENGGEYVPLILDDSSGGNLLYFQKYHAHEKRLKERMEAYLRAGVSMTVKDRQIDRFIDEIYSDPLAIRAGAGNTPLAKDPHQIKAIRLSLTSQFSIISGGPGTGKTSLMVNILRCLVRAGVQASRIILGAPTGRAAQRMTEMIQKNIATIREAGPFDSALVDLKGSTLHKILRYRSFDNGFYYRESNPLPAAVVVVDEVSMADVVMLDTFLRALDPEKTKLIFLGDKDQLPSVEAGAVLAEMTPDGTRAARFKDRFVVLQEVYRTGVELLKLADQINKGIFPDLKTASFQRALSIEPDQWVFVHSEGLDKWRENLHRWADRQYLNPAAGGGESFRELIFKAGEMTIDHLLASGEGLLLMQRIFSSVERARILSILRNGVYGCTVINNRIADYLVKAFNETHAFDPSRTRQTPVFPGAVMIIIRNDYSKGLFNGDVGVMIKDADGAYRAFFHRSGSFVSFPVNLLPPWELAFAMTVHKSQGSEFGDVLVVLPDDVKNRLLSREIIYTGITRAKDRVVLYGTPSVLDAALEKKMDRQSGLMW